MELFGIRDLRERMGDLSRTAEAGKLAVITRRDRPLMAGIPFNESLLQEGVHISLAVHLFSQGVITPAKAAEWPDYLWNPSFGNWDTLGYRWWIMTRTNWSRS